MKAIKEKKENSGSNSNLIIDNKSGVQKQNTTEDLSSFEPDSKAQKSFYVSEFFVIALSLSNSMLGYFKYQNSIETIVASVIFLALTVILSAVFYILESRLSYFVKISHPFIFLFGGLGVVVTDPAVLYLFTQKPEVSYCPSLLQLILLTTFHSSVKSSINLNIISFILGILSFGLSIAYLKNIETSVYLLLVLGCTCAKFGFKTPQSKKTQHFSEKYDLGEGSFDLDLGEIIEGLQLSIESLSNILKSSKERSLPKVVENLERIWTSLKKNKNIYSAKIDSITKNMDEQDRLFIEQSCFQSLANMVNTNRESIKIKENPSLAYGVSELMGLLSLIGKDWNYNTFFINDCTGGEPIQVIGLYSIKRYGLDEICKIPESFIKNFLKKLENSYLNNPYHNSTHGADVMCSYLYLVNSSDLSKHLTSVELLAGIIATLGHDVGHPGKTNRFLILTKDDIALAYNDISVLENMHASIIFNILKREECNILQQLSSEKYALTRKVIIDMVLATDMSKHFDMMAQFRVKYYEAGFVDFFSLDARYDVFRILMKAADIGHAAKSLELHEKWCRLVVEEFYEQGDLEKDLGIPVSMYCDRETTDISKSQAGFIKNIVYPLFSTLNSVLVSEPIEVNCLSQIRTNELYWIMRRKTIRGQSLISRKEEYVNSLNSLPEKRKVFRKPSLPDKYFP